MVLGCLACDSGGHQEVSTPSPEKSAAKSAMSQSGVPKRVPRKVLRSCTLSTEAQNLRTQSTFSAITLAPVLGGHSSKHFFSTSLSWGFCTSLDGCQDHSIRTIVIPYQKNASRKWLPQNKPDAELIFTLTGSSPHMLELLRVMIGSKACGWGQSCQSVGLWSFCPEDWTQNAATNSRIHTHLVPNQAPNAGLYTDLMRNGWQYGVYQHFLVRSANLKPLASNALKSGGDVLAVNWSRIGQTCSCGNLSNKCRIRSHCHHTEHRWEEVLLNCWVVLPTNKRQASESESESKKKKKIYIYIYRERERERKRVGVKSKGRNRENWDPFIRDVWFCPIDRVHAKEAEDANSAGYDAKWGKDSASCRDLIQNEAAWAGFFQGLDLFLGSHCGT